MTKLIRYTAADFASYHAGTMPPNDMNALEKAMLDDPFLADAVEGYTFTNTAAADVKGLKEALYKTKKTALVKKIPFSGWRIAASILFIGLAAYFFYWLNGSKTPVAIAKTETTVTSEADTLLAVTGNNAEAIITPNTAEKDLFETDKAVATSTDEKKQQEKELLQSRVAEEPVMNDVKDGGLSPIAPQQTGKSAPVALMNNSQNYNSFMQQGMITDSRGGPLQNITLKDVNSNNVARTDNYGKFVIQTADSNAVVAITSNDFKTKKVLLNQRVSNNIVLRDSVTGIDFTAAKAKVQADKVADVAVLSTDQFSKKTTATSPSAKKESATSQISVAEINNFRVDSTEGYRKFNDYVRRNITPVFGAEKKTIGGIVVVSFNVNKYGKPEKVKIVSSACEGCNNQAIKLVKNMPVGIFPISSNNYVQIIF